MALAPSVAEAPAPAVVSPPPFVPEPPVFPEAPAYVPDAPPALEAPPAALVAPSLPPLPAALPSVAPMSGTPSLPPPPSSRFAAAQARVVGAVPPRWLEVARQHPVLWMVGAPVLFGTLLILLAAALAPTPIPRVAQSPEATSPSAPSALPTPEPASPGAAAPEEPTRSGVDVAALEGKSADQLSVDEVLAVHGARARKKLEKVQALSRKLRESPDSSNDAETQAQLFHFAADADTASAALVAMTHARAPVGADLLYEVWSNRSASPGTTELARALLQSPDVRAGTSPALAVAVELRSAEQCEAIEAALPKAQSDGDRRSLPLLAKLNVKRGCGPDKKDDCFACLRSHTKQVLATASAVKKRAAPSYPARSAP